MGDELAAHKCPVLAAQVFENRFPVSYDDPGVLARDAPQIERDPRFGRAPEDVLAREQWNLTLAPDDAKRRGRGWLFGGLGCDRAKKRVAEAVDGAQ